MRQDGRTDDQLRPIKIIRHFTTTAPGSVLWQQGNTIVWCTAAVSFETPPWFTDDKAGGWVTCEYVMLPASTPQRKPWPRTGHTDSRGTEIQRIIGRSLRAALDLTKIGPVTIALDCQVMQADGGTRTASICGAYVALVDALATLPATMPMPRGRPPTGPAAANPPPRFDTRLYDPKGALAGQIAAVSTGIVDGSVRLDLDYHDDSRAQVDLNVACTAAGKLVEIQGSAENGDGFDRAEFNQMLDLALTGCRQIMQLQNDALAGKT
jgi:ribonuclease PH